MIQIDIPMPKSCKACRFWVTGEYTYGQFVCRCAVTKYYIGDELSNDKTRHPSCPLHEADALERAAKKKLNILSMAIAECNEVEL